jgi:predicted amidohydrolase YtcJ
MRLKISQLYDSHVHWLGTGQIETGLKLFHLTSSADVAHLDIKPHYFREEWLLGFGWDQTRWPQGDLPRKEILDRVFPNHPVMFQRIDGHSSWLNSEALRRFGFDSAHSGLLIEDEHFKAYAKLPLASEAQLRSALLEATRLFNLAGFTHIRDMTCDEPQWKQAVALDQAGELTLYVQENFLCETPSDIDRILAVAEKARSQETTHLKVQGLKVFFDGTLGSDTAYLSKCSCAPQSFSWANEDLEKVIRGAWSRGFEIAVHTIGDEAAHQVVNVARNVMSTNEVTGWLNLEHVEVLRPETLQCMKALHVRCHMQPCHWLSDRAWIENKLGELYKYAFPWGAISRAGIPLHFGSDSPVAKISFWDNQRALKESIKAKIPALKGDLLEHHCFPAISDKENYAVFDSEILQELYFDGKKII